MRILAPFVVSCAVVLMHFTSGYCADWPSLFQDVRFEPPTIESIEQQRIASVQKHAEMLQRFRREQHGQSWMDYLGVEEVSQLLSVPATNLQLDATTAKQQTVRLDTLRERMVGTHRGLEMQQILAFRKSLAEYVRLRQTYEQQESIAAELPDRIEKLQKILPESGTFTNESFHSAALHVQWLKSHSIAPRLTGYLESKNQPNVFIRLTDKAIENITLKPVTQSKPIDKVEDGRRILGEANTSGRARLVPVPGTGTGQCRVDFQSTSNIILRSREGPVSFQISALSNLNADKRVFFRQDAFTLSQTLVNVNTQMHTDAICTKKNGPIAKLIRKFAAKEIQKSHPDSANQINQEARQEFLEEFESEIAQEIAEAHQDLREDVLEPLTRLDLQPKSFEFASNYDHLGILLRVDGGLGLTTHDQPVAIPDAHQVGVFIHESVINQVTERLLGGETFNNLAQAATEAGVKLSEEQKQDFPEIGIKFATHEPVRVWFNENVIRIQVAGDSFTVGTALLDAMNVTVAYQISNQGSKLKFKLIGEPEVSRPTGKGAAGRYLAQRRVLKSRLSEELPQEFSVAVPKMPDPLSKMNITQFSHASAGNGWLRVGM